MTRTISKGTMRTEGLKEWWWIDDDSDDNDDENGIDYYETHHCLCCVRDIVSVILLPASFFNALFLLCFSQMRVYEVFHGKFHRSFERGCSLSSVAPTDIIVVWVLTEYSNILPVKSDFQHLLSYLLHVHMYMFCTCFTWYCVFPLLQ